MAEEFNPTAFRQQMAQQAGQIPAPVSAPQAPAVPQMPPSPVQGHPQAPAPAPQQYAPQPPAPQQHVPQYAPQPQHAPQQPVQYQGQPHPGQFQPPQQQFQPQLQQGYAQPPQHTQTNHQGNNQGQMVSQGEIETPKAKRSLFKRKKLKSLAMPTASQMPQIPGQIPGQISGQISGQMGAAMEKMPTAGGIARPIVFAAGVLLGALGTMMSIMLFSGDKPQRANIASNAAQLSSEMPISEGSTQMALTDDMILNSQASKNGKP